MSVWKSKIFLGLSFVICGLSAHAAAAPEDKALSSPCKSYRAEIWRRANAFSARLKEYEVRISNVHEREDRRKKIVQSMVQQMLLEREKLMVMTKEPYLKVCGDTRNRKELEFRRLRDDVLNINEKTLALERKKMDGSVPSVFASPDL